MLLQWVLNVSLCSLVASAPICNSRLGNAIRPSDCQVALNILITRLKLIPPYNQNFEPLQHMFTLDNDRGDPRWSMPQGAQFESCGIAVDIHPATTAVTTWNNLLQQLVFLISDCPSGRATYPPVRGLGGTSSMGQFIFIVVDPGQGMRNIVGTCLIPRPPHTQGVVWRLAERLCGFQSVAQLFPIPDTSQLPPAPALFPLGVTFSNVGIATYRVRGQWLWNADAWSPTIVNPFTTRLNVRQLWILMTAGNLQPFALAQAPPPFSRTIPRVMATAWIRLQQNSRFNFRGAWGSRASTWVGLSGDLTNFQGLLASYDWLLIELGVDMNPSISITMPSLQQASPTATNVYALLPQDEILGASARNLGMPEESAGANQISGLPLDRGSVVRGRRHGLLMGQSPAGNEVSRPDRMSGDAVGVSQPFVHSVASPLPFPAPTPIVGEGGIINPSLLGLYSALHLSLQGVQTPSTVEAIPSPVLPSRQRNMAEMNLVTNDTFWDIGARPSKKPRRAP